ncbi:MAG: 4-hydroxythreonine-4-phosphate dehydrogenase PdxA [Solobacterium sp.]|nr:4-hydroxythreonine-4-phosphate dehydrogenase PdxA [Solobacterium sp.]
MMNSNRPLIVIPMGDPAGIGPEITVKALSKKEICGISRSVVTGDLGILEKAADICGIDTKFHVIGDPAEGIYEEGTIDVIDLHNIDPGQFCYGKVSAMCGRAAYEYIEKAIELAMAGKADAVATTTINKESLRAADVPYIGHTEIFGALTGTEEPLTMFELEDMRILFLSRHMSLRKACDYVTKEHIISCVRKGYRALQQLGIEDPRIGVAGLNPHCGEHGLFGDEEVREIIPAVEELQEEGYRVYGPVGADSVFWQARNGRYDCVLSLYHDQGHIASKTVDFNRTISITCGMPILRTSVDHGTAFDIAGKGIADEISLCEAVRKAVRYAPAFRRSRD